MKNKANTGVLLINLGTPDAANPKAVRRYLRQFLSDPRVVDVPTWVRWLLLYLIILPIRPRQSAKAYQAIWSAEGSPLLVHSQQLVQAVAAQLGLGYQVVLGMRYGNPSIQHALEQLSDCTRLIVLPLFPQYSSAASGSTIAATLSALAQQWNIPQVIVQRDFYDEPGFIAAYARIMQQHLQHKPVDHILFSYHGLPERHIIKSCCTAQCDHLNACPAVDDSNRYCYRAQCYATTQALLNALSLPQLKYTVAFQSRLGRIPWIKPYTDNVLDDLVQSGVRHLVVVCPSFVADCLETLEEIGIRAQHQWHTLGGKTLTLVPCLNSNAVWVDSLANKIIQLNESSIFRPTVTQN